MHLLALKTASVAISVAAFYLGITGQLDFTSVILVVLLSFHIFGSLEPISDCAHVLAIIDDALDHLDEATASVDPENEHLIQAAISELTRGKTIVTIVHRLATIEQADQILVVDDGQIVQSGTHSQLVQVPGKYKDFVDIRSKSEGWKLA